MRHELQKNKCNNCAKKTSVIRKYVYFYFTFIYITTDSFDESFSLNFLKF